MTMDEADSKLISVSLEEGQVRLERMGLMASFCRCAERIEGRVLYSAARDILAVGDWKIGIPIYTVRLNSVVIHTQSPK